MFTSTDMSTLNMLTRLRFALWSIQLSTLLLPSPVTIDTKNHLILLICLYKTSDEGVYRKAKKCLKL